MSLPAPSSQWPPAELRPALTRMREWKAWWAGDVDELATIYGGARGGGPAFVNRPSQYAGGVVGKVARMWWGRPSAANEPDAKMHIPLGGDICRTSADLLYAEPVTVTAGDDRSSQRLASMFDEGGQGTLLEGAELRAAMGGAYLRPVHDKTISDRAWLDTVAPDRAVPEWRWGRLVGATFWRIVRSDDARVWRHFERHVPGWIVHALYEGTGDNVGRLVPLEDCDATRGLASQVNSDSAIATGYDGLDVVYVPNMRPNPLWMDKPMLAPMGKPDLRNLEPILDALDETYSSWMRDIRLAKGRVFAASGLLDDHGHGKGATWDPDREFYAEIPGALAAKDSPLTVVQFDIRVQEHQDTARELVAVALRTAGYSTRTIGDRPGEGGMKTATEVKADERRSFITRDRKIGYERTGLVAAARALLAVDDAVFGTHVSLEDVHVGFADSVSEDLMSLANVADALNRAQAASIETRVRLIWPEWSEPQVRREVDRIRAEQGPVMGDPMDIAYGDDGAGDEGGQPDEDTDPDAESVEGDEQ